ncbi:MAG: lysoplasmalogenase [Bacteroidia bacterium]|nr:lysoplasmalogenase [Bacteroidia bacterium]
MKSMFSISRFRFLFFILLLLEILFEVSGDDRTGVYLTKPLIMLLLIAWLQQQSGLWQGSRRWLTLGFIFSLLGDILLMFRRDDLFVFGLGAFLVAHVFYILTFFSETRGIEKYPFFSLLMRFIPFLVFYAAFMWVAVPRIQTKDPNLSIPVMVYAFVICLMGWAASLRQKAVTPASFSLVLVGAVLFILSDTCIAVNKFLYPFDAAPVVIMALYGAGQYAIAHGFILQHPKDHAL